MKIVNIEKGEPYELKPGTKIEVERPNPFFNDYGEQTVPLSIPATDHNRRLLGFPDLPGMRSKMQPVDVSISDGDYYAQCRQLILSAQYKGDISTSFYINDGSFYSRIQNIKLKEIFGKETIEGVDSVASAIDFCRKLRANTDSRFCIFPVLLTDDSGLDTGLNYKILNAFCDDDSAKIGSGFNPDSASGDFYNAVPRSEYIEEMPISLPRGYYISPFIRANYVLQRVFSYFGYTLRENFFTKTEPFDKMVLLNKVIDVLVNGHIYLADLVPEITISDFLGVFRKKFCCEFVADETTKRVSVIFLRDMIAATPTQDLTSMITSHLQLSFKSEKDFKRIVLKSESKVPSELDDSYDNLADMVAANPAAYANPSDGAFYKEGFSGDYPVTTKIAEASLPYDTGESAYAVQESKIPDCIPEFRSLYYKEKEDDAEGEAFSLCRLLYTGDYVTMNSKLEITGSENQENEEKEVKQTLMLAFAYTIGGRAVGSITGYNVGGTFLKREIVTSDYALYYNGEKGLFNRFWRDYDTLLRNSLQTIKAKILMSQLQKRNLPAYGKYVVNGVPVFFDKLKFTLGGKEEPTENSLLSADLKDPVAMAPKLSEQLPAMSTEYKWVGRITEEEVTQSVYNRSGDQKDYTFRIVYPPVASKDWVGKKYAEQVSYMAKEHFLETSIKYRWSYYDYVRVTVWLECVKKA